MYKEMIISIVLIISIFIGNYTTQEYTKKATRQVADDLKNLKQEIQIENVDIGRANKKLEKIENKWENINNKMAYFIEHDELEKIQNNLTGCRSYLENKEYVEAIQQLDTACFVLKHIEEKNKFDLKNIF